MAELTIEHVASRGFASGVVTGATFTGPTSDGFVHITFHRDLQRVVEDYVNVDMIKDAAGNDAQLYSSARDSKIATIREDVAQVSIEISKLSGLADGFARMAEQLRKIYEAGGFQQAKDPHADRA